MTLTERLTRQLAECHKALLLTGHDLEAQALLDGLAPSQQEQCRKAAAYLRAFVARQKEGKV